jgi:hypothetical protein
MRARILALICFALLVATSGCGAEPIWHAPWIDLRDGTRFPPREFESEVTVLAIQAGHDLGCSAHEIAVTRASADRPERVFIAEGCGKREVYLKVSWMEFWRDHATVIVTRFVALTTDWQGQLRQILSARDMRMASEIPKGGFVDPADDTQEIVAAFAALLVRGAHDLHCPVEQVVPGMDDTRTHLWPIAEGCGKRVIYLPEGPPYRARRIKSLDDTSSIERGTAVCPIEHATP